MPRLSSALGRAEILMIDLTWGIKSRKRSVMIANAFFELFVFVASGAGWQESCCPKRRLFSSADLWLLEFRELEAISYCFLLN
jgi:hypothetical protein